LPRPAGDAEGEGEGEGKILAPSAATSTWKTCGHVSSFGPGQGEGEGEGEEGDSDSDFIKAKCVSI